MLASVELLHWLHLEPLERKDSLLQKKKKVDKIVAIYSQLARVPITLHHKLQAWSCMFEQGISE